MAAAVCQLYLSTLLQELVNVFTENHMLFNCSMRIKIEVKIMVRCKLCHIFYFGISFPSCLPVVHISHIYNFLFALLYHGLSFLDTCQLNIVRVFNLIFSKCPHSVFMISCSTRLENFLVLIRMYRFIYNIEQV